MGLGMGCGGLINISMPVPDSILRERLCCLIKIWGGLDGMGSGWVGCYSTSRLTLEEF